MKILFDSQIFDSQKYGGISRYFVELFKYFNKNNTSYELPIKDTRNEYLKNLEPFSDMNLSRKILFPNINFKLQRLLSKIYDLISPDSNINKTKRTLKKQDFDVFHPTYYSTYFLKYLKKKPFVLTVYDMIHEIYPEYFFSDRTVNLKKKLIPKADRIIAISESTKRDILHFYKIPEDKIKVIYLGNSLQPKTGILKIPNLPNKYILFVGARGIYKNFIFFVKSISPLLVKDRELSLVVAGGYSGADFFSKEERDLFKELNIENQIVHFSINDETLASLYKNALCFVFPTLYEGFGIPILEAFACDCPAVISNTSSLPEVGGDSAIYFDPKDKDDILSSVEKVIYNQDLRNELILKGRERLKKFSWENTASETLSVYRDILKL